MSGPATYAVDLDQLADTIRDLTTCDQAFGDLLDELRGGLARLHLTWTGQAAAAHAAAQAEWERGFDAMRQGLGGMREAGRVAHDDYTAAVDANVRLWSAR